MTASEISVIVAMFLNDKLEGPRLRAKVGLLLFLCQPGAC